MKACREKMLNALKNGELPRFPDSQNPWEPQSYGIRG